MSESTARLEYKGKVHELKVRPGTVGPEVIDIATLYRDTGAFTYAPVFTSTDSSESQNTNIDADAGVLLHRGYRFDQLAEHSDFLEVCYLLLYVELPTKEQ